MTTIGFIGSGNIGSSIARAAIARGDEVVLSNSRGPETLAELVAELGEHARAATPAEAAAAADLVVVTVPFKAVNDLPVEPFVGKIVMDTNNYYPQRDGVSDEIESGAITVSGVLQRHLVDAKVVKAFNHIQALQIISTATRAALRAAGRWRSPGMTSTPSGPSPTSSTGSASTWSTSARSRRAGASTPARPDTVPSSPRPSSKRPWPRPCRGGSAEPRAGRASSRAL